ncbi:hypothetical protein ACU4GR_06015 [Methylobacterium oryzae CBMB20]
MSTAYFPGAGTDPARPVSGASVDEARRGTARRPFDAALDDGRSLSRRIRVEPALAPDSVPTPEGRCWPVMLLEVPADGVPSWPVTRI